MVEELHKGDRLRRVVEDVDPILAPLGRAFRKAFSAFERDVGMGPPRYYVLSLLAGADGLSQGEVGRLFEVDSSRITSLAKALEGDGFISRRRDPQDNRFVRMYLTPEGREAFESASGRVGTFRERLADVLGRDEVEDLRRLLGGVTEAMSADRRVANG